MLQIFSRDDLSNVVVNLRQNTNGGQIKTGTGIFVIHANKLYLFTASHVANDMSITGKYILRGENDIPVTLTIQQLISGFNATSIPWRHHAVADLAVLDLSPPQATINQYFIKRFLPSDNIYNQKVSVSRDIELTSLGFPLGLGAVGHFSPLSFRTFASSGFITLLRFDNQQPCDFFILENPTVGGYSGGPIFDISIYRYGNTTTTGNGTMLYGITHGTLNDQTGGKMAAITPSHFIFDLI